ncbi:MAG TPA: ATP-binding cassette domain-containing protein [Acidimicrobiales bacterium]|nr:ATP-binding cassette domain-containing protein [Acidimicrobiales bacterium]
MTHDGGASDAVVLDDVHVVRGGRTVWSEGSFSVPRGAVVIVIGPNGSGKTTLLQLLLGLLSPASGAVTVLGSSPATGSPRVGYVPQNYTANVGDAIRCRDLVTLGITGRRWGLRPPTPDERARVSEALERVGALEHADRRLSELSGGQQQRVAIAQALVDRPDLLLLDEPLANLDVRNQQEIVALLADLHRTTDVTIFVVAHDMNPLLSVLTGAVYLLDGHPHYGPIGEIVDEGLLTHLYGTRVRVVRTAQGDFFTRSG